ncbi:MAG TPA: ABC transporter substrate-binding protein [Planctomycetota bacterium]|nr:ABC transporter substrate-binding protein [Planctomycetota bacterium]
MSSSTIHPRRSASLQGVLWLAPLFLLGILGYVGYLGLNADARPAPAVPNSSSSDYPLTVTEADGRKVVIPRKPMRIIATNAGMADILSVLIPPERIAAVPDTVDGFAGNTKYFAEHKEIKRFGKYQAEPLLALKPDLILSNSFQDSTTTDILEKNGIPVLRFEYYKTMNSIRESVLIVGKAVGENEKARQLVENFDARIAAVKIAVAGRPRPRVLSYSNYGQGYAVGVGESQDEIITIAGAVNAAAEMNLKGHVHFTFEQMLKLNPDWLIVSGEQGLNSPQIKILMNEPTLAQLPALKNNKVAVIPDNVYSSISHYVVDAIELLAKQLHPDAKFGLKWDCDPRVGSKLPLAPQPTQHISETDELK